MKIEIVIDPLPQSRPRFTRGGRCYELPKMTAYKKIVTQAAQSAMQGFTPAEGTELTCKIKIWRKFKPTSRRFGDADNHAKSILDALNGVVFADDALVTSLNVEKFQSSTPKVEIEINQKQE